MLEIGPTDVGVIACVADPQAVDALASVPGALACRVAPDEAMLLTSPDAASSVAATVMERTTATDTGALVLDATDGWAALTLRGDTAADAFGRLSAVPLVPGFLQCDVARVPVKVVASQGSIHLLVPAMWRDYLRERILARCANLGILERTEPVAWASPKGERS